MNLPEKIVDGHVHLLDETLLKNNRQHLTLFLSLLTFSKVKRPYKFSYVPSLPTPIKSSSLQENLLIDSSLIGLGVNREEELSSYFLRSKNDSLKELFKIFTSRVAPITTEEERLGIKLGALILSLIRPCNYLLLEHPEKHLPNEIFTLYQKALIFEMNEETKTLLLATTQLDQWEKFSCLKVEQQKDNKRFHFIPLTPTGRVITIPHERLITSGQNEIIKKVA